VEGFTSFRWRLTALVPLLQIQSACIFLNSIELDNETERSLR
jgi:hypothetical protein